jgi:hypothetical protein
MWSLLTAFFLSRGRAKLCKANDVQQNLARSANRANYQSIASIARA